MKIPPLFKEYSGVTVLDLPEFEIPDASITAVIGANGSGKTTFVRILSGLEKDDKNAALPFASAGIMLQKSFAFRMSTLKNIMLGGPDQERARVLMDSLGLQAVSASHAQKLSGGEMAKMSLARILMRHYDLLILDEPTASMDMESTLASEKLIQKYCAEEHSTVILITHSIQQAKRIADHVLFFSHGHLAESGPAGELLYSPQEESTREFLKFF